VNRGYLSLSYGLEADGEGAVINVQRVVGIGPARYPLMHLGPITISPTDEQLRRLQAAIAGYFGELPSPIPVPAGPPPVSALREELGRALAQPIVPAPAQPDLETNLPAPIAVEPVTDAGLCSECPTCHARVLSFSDPEGHMVGCNEWVPF